MKKQHIVPKAKTIYYFLYTEIEQTTIPKNGHE